MAHRTPCDATAISTTDEEMAPIPRLADLDGMRRWTAWQTELRPGRAKPTKVPYGASGARARANDPGTWLTLAEARTLAASLPRPFGTGGIGIFLGDLGDGWGLGGADYDSCIDGAGLADWAEAGVAAIASYGEVSPSGTGLKQFFIYRTAETDTLRTVFGIGAGRSGQTWKRDGGGDHPPAIEIYLTRRFFTVTGDCEGLPSELAVLSADGARKLMTVALPLLLGDRAPGADTIRRPAHDCRVLAAPPTPDALKTIDKDALATIVREIPNGSGFDDRGEWLAFAHALAAAFADDPGLARELWLEHAAKRPQADDEPERVWRSLRGPHLAGADWLVATARAAGIDVSRYEQAKARAAFDAAGPLPVVTGLSSSDPNTLKPELIVHAADRPETVRAVLNVLVQDGNLFDRGGVLVRLVHSPDGGPPRARALTYNNVIVETHRHCQPVTFNPKGEKVAITLPDPVARMLLDLGEWGLPPLAGVTTAPLLAPDGSILVRSGYDRAHAMWCEPVPDLTVPTQPTRAEAEAALLLLRNTFRTFPFAGSVLVPRGTIMEVDMSEPPSSAESTFLAALLTGCCRPSFRLAPGVLIVAPEVSGAGSGKGLLVRAICQIAFGCSPSAFTPGHDRQELDKRLVAALIEAGPALFLDNLNSTALRSNTLASVLTERPAYVRIMGRSEMVPLNCAAFIAVTGNGLSVSEDLARRFLEVLLDARCEDPEARDFPAGFLTDVLTQRTALLAAALTIWRWGRQNAADLTRGLPFGSFETWAEWVRDPLLALGCQDPVERVRVAKANDPRRRHAAELFATWWEHHRDRPVTAAQLAEPVRALVDPQGHGRQYVAARLVQMDGARAGGFVLTRQPAMGKWSAATYALVATVAEATEGIGHRDHRGDRGAAGPNQRPMIPMPPMPDVVGDAGETKSGQPRDFGAFAAPSNQGLDLWQR